MDGKVSTTSSNYNNFAGRPIIFKKYRSIFYPINGPKI